MSHDILVVDGGPAERRANRELLERAGYVVREIPSLDTALNTAREAPPEVILIEVADDLGASVRFMKRLRRHPRTQHVPVIVLTPASPGDDSSDEAPRVTWLPEPCPPRTLLEEVAYLTRPRLRVDAAFSAPNAS